MGDAGAVGPASGHAISICDRSGLARRRGRAGDDATLVIDRAGARSSGMLPPSRLSTPAFVRTSDRAVGARQCLDYREEFGWMQFRSPKARGSQRWKAAARSSSTSAGGSAQSRSIASGSPGCRRQVDRSLQQL